MGGKLWNECMAAVAGIAEKASIYDTNGIDVYFLNSPASLSGVKDVNAVRQLFNQVAPLGESTPTEMRVEQLLSPYVEAVEKCVAASVSLSRTQSQGSLVASAKGIKLRGGD